MSDIEAVVDPTHQLVFQALIKISSIRSKLMVKPPAAGTICEHLDVCTMGVLKDKRESAALCAVSFDSPFDRIFCVESTQAIADIADCGRNFVHGLCTGRYGQAYMQSCHRCVTGKAPWCSQARPEGQEPKTMSWREQLQLAKMEAVEWKQGAVHELLPISNGTQGTILEIPINTMLPVPNATSVAQALNSILASRFPDAVTQVTLSTRDSCVRARAEGSITGLHIPVRLARRSYRGDTVWAVQAADAARLWEMLGVVPHLPLECSARQCRTPLEQQSEDSSAELNQAVCTQGLSSNRMRLPASSPNRGRHITKRKSKGSKGHRASMPIEVVNLVSDSDSENDDSQLLSKEVNTESTVPSAAKRRCAPTCQNSATAG